jgi:hypothetical protein
MSNIHFSDLTMPVFSAFGWAGQEAAITFALSQMELFINSLCFSLPREVLSLFPHHGLDRESQSVYLATQEEPGKGMYIAFYARPMSWEITLSISDKDTLTKALKIAESRSEKLFELLINLGEEWSLRFQQMEYDEKNGTATHYQDLFKDSIGNLNLEMLTTIVAKANYLNGENQWVLPFQISRRSSSEKVSAMGTALIGLTSKEINALLPLCNFLSGKTRRAVAKPKTRSRPKKEVETTTPRQLVDAAKLDQFSYVSELQPLHLRRGFINLTADHWPFFAKNVRAVTRSVSLKYGEKADPDCSVWRLVPHDQARLVLSPSVHQWLEDEFQAHEQIQIKAIRNEGDDILITLETVD